MQRIKSITAVLDILGAGALVAAGAALSNVTGLLQLVPEAQALTFFGLSFVAAVISFGAARLMQIGDVIRTSVNPRRERLHRAAVEALQPTEAAPPAPNPFQRAA
jgi:Na+-transporting methylmalonyl-CoA/oxaloacetate decarboxylase gamma subunit